jgi:Domain of unknown function (DUF4129)
MMKKFFDHKSWAVLAACLAVLMLVLLAAGLGNLHFQPGRSFAQGKSLSFQFSIEKVSEEIASIPTWKQVVFLFLVFLLVIIVIALLPPKWRKKILKYFLRYALFVLFLWYIVKNFRVLLPALNLAMAGTPKSSVPNLTETAQSVFMPPQVPSMVLYLISLGIILALALIVFLISRRWLQKQDLQKNSRPLEGMAKIARSSLADISSGRNWEDVIINCYARMSDVAGTQRGLHRRKDLTAGEFAFRLEGSGLPGEAVRRLTRLFEAARYGVRHASREETAEAIACLTTVLNACGINE